MRLPDASAPFAALAFKVMSDPFVGRLTFLRVYSGTVTAGANIVNATKDKKERIGRLLMMHANHREDIEKASAGDIVAAVGLKTVTTGDTLSDIARPIVLERMTFPDPVISVAIEPKTKGDQDRLAQALRRLSEEDPTFRVRSDEETGQTLIAGMGELHLEIIVDRLTREFNVDANVGAPQVAYRETIRKRVEKVEGRFVRQSGGRGQFGHVYISMEPNEPGKGYEFTSKVVGGNIPKEYITPTDNGIREALESGILAGYPMVDIKVELIDGSYHDVDSSEMAFKIAGSMAAKAAAQKAISNAARAGHGRRGRRPRGLHRRRRRRHQPPPRSDRRHRTPRRDRSRDRDGPAVGDVRLRHVDPQRHPGPRDVHHAVPALRAGAPEHRGADQGEIAEGPPAGRPLDCAVRRRFATSARRATRPATPTGPGPGSAAVTAP